MAFTPDQTYPQLQGTFCLNDFGLSRTIAVPFVRPSNTNVYSANQVVTTTAGGALTIPNATRVLGKGGLLLNVILLDQNNAATPLQPVIYLFTALPTTLADQATLALAAADSAATIAVVPLYQTYLDNSGSAAAGLRRWQAATPPIPYFPAAGTSIYAYVVSTAAYTPLSAEAFTLILGLAQD